jgi:serine/threonine-protein phosphatase 6 regulatory subunit 3
MLQWLENQRVVQRVVQLLAPGTEAERHCNAAQLLLEVIRISRDNMRTASSDRAEPDPVLARLES